MNKINISALLICCAQAYTQYSQTFVQFPLKRIIFCYSLPFYSLPIAANTKEKKTHAHKHLHIYAGVKYNHSVWICKKKISKYNFCLVLIRIEPLKKITMIFHLLLLYSSRTLVTLYLCKKKINSFMQLTFQRVCVCAQTASDLNKWTECDR